MEYFASTRKFIFSIRPFESLFNPGNGQIYMAWQSQQPGRMDGPGKFKKPTWNWYTDETLLIENARTGLIWKLFMSNEHIQAGIRRASFQRNLKPKSN